MSFISGIFMFYNTKYEQDGKIRFMVRVGLVHEMDRGWFVLLQCAFTSIPS